MPLVIGMMMANETAVQLILTAASMSKNQYRHVLVVVKANDRKTSKAHSTRAVATMLAKRSTT